MSKFKIGQNVWVARFNKGLAVTVPCPVCYGNRKVTLRLGNGEEVELACDYCGKGNYGNPTGHDIEYQPISAPQLITIDGMEIKITSKGEQVEYWAGADNCHTIFHEDNLFAHKSDAEAKGEELKQAWLEDERTRTEHLKANSKKSFSWNAGYHLRNIKQLEKQIEYHKEKAKLCKERSDD